MHVEVVRTVEQIESVSPNRLVALYLIASFAYYHLDASVMQDEAYDRCCQRLADEWFFIDHPHKHIIDQGSLSATTGYTLREGDYPTIVKLSARALINFIHSTTEEEDLHMSGKITIKTIQERLGIALTGTFITDTLGIAPIEKEARSVFWGENQYPEICDKLIAHINDAKGSTVVAAKPAPKDKKKDEKAEGGGFDFGGGGEAAEVKSGASNGFDFGGQGGEEEGFNFGGNEEPAEEGFKF